MSSQVFLQTAPLKAAARGPSSLAAMPRNNTTQALERLGYLLNSGSIEQLKLALGDFEQIGLQRDKIINFPMQRYNGRTAVHLAASNGLFDCLELLLKCGGKGKALQCIVVL